MDGKAVARAIWTMVKAVGRFLRWLVLLLFVGCEVLFWGYSIIKLISGGPDNVVGWWWHLQTEGDFEHAQDPFHWGQFLLGHALILAVFWTLWLFELRYRKQWKAMQRSVIL